MKIIYIAKHDSGGGDDEGAITHALTSLGHQVERIREHKGYTARKLPQGDFVLFHKWYDLYGLKSIKIPRVFWYFDLVDWPSDPTLARRCSERMQWMREITPLVDLGFCTDGDWVQQDRTDKLHWLPQGADERVTGRGCIPTDRKILYPLLFTGIRKGGGQKRISFVEEMQTNYGQGLTHVASGVYGREMANLIAQHQIVVAPDSPVTDRYWSNRVYGALGYGAFLLHPYCERLREQYSESELIMYRDRNHLTELIYHYLSQPSERQRISCLGLNRTINQHLYRHRCEQMIQTVRERLGIQG